MSFSPEEIKKRFDLARKRKTWWETLYEECMEYASPHRELFNDFSLKGEKRQNTDLVFDSTAPIATTHFVSNLQSSLVPPMKQWIKLKPGHDIPEEQRDEKERELEKITEAVFDFIKTSNFDTQVSTSFYDLAVGVATLKVDRAPKGANPLRFNSVNIAQVYIDEGAEGTVDTVFRTSRMTLDTIKKTWGEEEVKIPAAMEQQAKGQRDKEFEIIEATLPEKVMVYNPQTEQDEEVDGFGYYVCAPKFQEHLVERKETSSPWIVFRWPTLPGEIYARGPLVLSLPDIKTLNKAQELILKNGSLDMAGAYTVVDDGVINYENIRVRPGAFIPVDSNGGPRGASIAALPRPGKFDIGQIIIEERQTNIRKNLFAEPLGDINAPVKTATEVAMRQAELAKRIGSAFGRLQFEFLQPLINRILHILEEAGKIDLSGFRVDGNVIAIDYVSPLAQAQDEEDVMKATRYVESIIGLYGPQIGMALAPADVFSKYLRDKLGLPKDFRPSDQEIEMAKQMLAVQAAAQAEAAAQQQPEAA